MEGKYKVYIIDEVHMLTREAFNALFLNEARAAGGLSHPHIVTVFDAGVSDSSAYIAMELLEGTTYSKVIALIRSPADGR
jgi:serine/threonine protein kinase